MSFWERILHYRANGNGREADSKQVSPDLLLQSILSDTENHATYRIALAQEFYSNAMLFAKEDADRISFLLVDWLNSYQTPFQDQQKKIKDTTHVPLGTPLKQFIAENGISSKLEALIKKIGIMSCKNVQAKIAKKDTSKKSRTKNVEQLIRFMRLPKEIRPILQLNNTINHRETPKKVGYSVLYEIISQVWRRTADLLFFSQILIGSNTVEKIHAQGLLFIAPAIVACLTNEVLMYTLQKNALTNAGHSSKIMSTSVHRVLGWKEEYATLLQRFVGKAGWWEYFVWAAAASTQNIPMFISMVLLKESLAIISYAPDIAANYWLSKKKPSTEKNKALPVTHHL